MCFVHAEEVLPRTALVHQVALDEAAADKLTEGLVGLPRDPKVRRFGGEAEPPSPRQGSVSVLNGLDSALHNRWNRDLPSVLTVADGDSVRFLCRDALDLAEAGQALTADGLLTLDLGKVHPLTGPVAIEGAEPGDIVEVEVLDVRPLVDFGYAVITPALGLFGALGTSALSALHSLSEASELSDPSPGRVPGALPADQPHNLGAPFVQLFHFEKGQSTGFAEFRGSDTGTRAHIPITPFAGIMGVAPLRKGMYRTVPPAVSGGMGGNLDIKQFIKGSRIQFPVYTPGAKFSAGDGHMAQGDGEVCVAAIETLMEVTLKFRLIKNTIIQSPRAIVPASDPTELALTPEMLADGYYHTTGSGPDLMEDAKNAVRDMIDWLARDQHLSLHEAFVICSVIGDLKISEVVDAPNWVVSMVVPRGIFESQERQ
jgi:acetamidase/formamidase